jgi:hypothetical protein
MRKRYPQLGKTVPTPWFTYTNFSRPSQKNTAPAMSLKSKMDFGPSVGGFISHKKNLFIWLLLSMHITGATAKYSLR